MDIEKYTDRAKGFIQSAQGLALREGHQRLLPEHISKVLLDDQEGLAANLIEAAGGDASRARQAIETLLKKQPKVEGGGAGQVYLAPETARLFDAFREGNMSVRGEAAAFSGSFQQLVSGINNVIDAVAARGEEVRLTNELLLAQVEERQRAQRERDAMHAHLLDTARKAGMAEIATSVLHNLGNALNSVNIAAESSRELVKKWRVKDLAKIADLLDQHPRELGPFFQEGGRGKLVPSFLRKLSQVLEEDRALVLAEFTELMRMLDHAKEVVAWQQHYAGVAGVKEEISPVVLVEDALRITKVERDRERITVEKEFADVPILNVERHKVVQILVNLISNASNAIERAGRAQGTLSLRIRGESNKAVTFEIADDGIGIPAENMERLFQYGFTTREGGHGFGLHSCAITALELGGEIKAASEGAGKGARFMLTLPVGA